MTKNTEEIGKPITPLGSDFVRKMWDESWVYIKTVVDIVREPVLILNDDLHVQAANDAFYETFRVTPKDTEGKLVYELGNGQWNIPSLKKLLEDILPKDTFFKGFEVAHEFPNIGRKVMILNARQIHFKQDSASEMFPQIILLAMEDVSEMMVVAETLAEHANHLRASLGERTQKLEKDVDKLEKEITKLKNK